MKKPVCFNAIAHIPDSPPVDLQVEARWTPSLASHQRNFELELTSLDWPSSSMRIDLTKAAIAQIVAYWQQT